VESNLVGFTNLLAEVVIREVPNFIYASSSSVYGNNSTPPYSEDEVKISPNSFYGVTKYANELIIPTLVEGSKTRARGLRFFTVYGPWGRPDMAYFRMVSNVLSGSPFELFGNGEVQRDFTFIEDVVTSISKLHAELVCRKFGFYDVVNVGGGRPASMISILETISEISGKDVNFLRSNPNQNDVMLTISNPSYLYELTKFKPETDITEGLEQFVNWAKDSKVLPYLSKWVASSK
jgi:UDP-glucuronate 4-epimerase